MKIQEFLSQLRQLDIKLWVEGGNIHLDAPKGVLSPTFRAELAERKADILAYLQSTDMAVEPETFMIQPAGRDQHLQLSYAQERLWFLDQLEPGNPAYNMFESVHLKGALNCRYLERALNVILGRHEILRTNFETIADRPIQVMHPHASLPLTFIDLSNFGADEKLVEAKRLWEEAATHPFDLCNDLLIRATLLKLAEEDHVFLISMHHIVSDGWSMAVFKRELTTLYGAFADGLPNPLPPLRIQYADYAQWQREWLQGERLEAQLNYWKQKLAGELPQFEMLLDKPRTPAQSPKSGRASQALSAALCQALKQLSQHEGATLFMTLLAAFKMLLYRNTGLEDVVVGTPIAGRNRAETENLIGFFLNTLVLRTDLSGNPTFRELLRRVRKTATDSYTHQDIPFEMLLIELHPERNLNNTPLFQIFFNMVKLETGYAELQGLTAKVLDAPDSNSKFDLNMYVYETDDAVSMHLVYRNDLFHHEQITYLLEQYEHILNQIAADPDQSISTLPLLPTSMLNKLRPSIPRPSDFLPFHFTDSDSIASRFSHIVKLYPNNLAVRTDRQRLTYQELYDASTRVALILQQSHYDQIENVALLFEHDASMIVGLFGALLAGKTYVPLDPSYPRHRLEYILEHSQTRFILTNNRNLPLAKSLAANQIRVINIDIDLSAQEEFMPPSLDPNQVAYILFTSGSTGQPKGVIQSHRNVLHHICNYTNNLRITAADRLTLLSSYSFDAAVMAIYGALLNGAELHPYDVNASGLSQMNSWMLHEEITIYHSTPTLFRYFMDILDAEKIFPHVRIVVLGGEEVFSSDVDLFKQHFPKNSYFVNGLGPTESTLALQNILSHNSLVKWGSVSVGYPVEGIDVSLLDEAGRRAPLQGEIILQGRQVALGYWNRPALTDAAFQTIPEDSSIRTYRTGDLGRFLPDGRLLFLGRKDEQVKIRGFRVELGEIEATLNKHQDVKQAVVVAHKTVRGDKRLVAYVVPTSTQSFQANNLRDFLRQRLPDYMLPSSFISIDVIPLTASGKVDRNALIKPEDEELRPEGMHRAPRDETEEKLVKIWQDLLHVRKISVTDNFFELGGHSLMALRMFTRINEQFNVNLPLATLFQEATVEHLANVINRKATTWSSLIGTKTTGHYPPFFCIHGITGDILWFRDLAQCLAPNYPFYGVQARGLDGINDPICRIEEMATYYIDQIRSLQPNGPYFLGGASFGGTVALEIAQQLLQRGEQVALLAVFDHPPPNIKIDIDDQDFKNRLVMGAKVIRNFPDWLKDFLDLGSSRMLMRIRRKIRLAKKAKDQSDLGILEQVEASDIIDFAHEIPLYRQHLITSHYHAVKSYVPRPYPGQVTLFRAKSRPLLNTFDPEVAWQVLAPGRVRVIDISSSHEGMFRKPHVEDLARELKSCLSTDPVKPASSVEC